MHSNIDVLKLLLVNILFILLENSHQKLPTEGLLNKKKKSLRKNKTPSKILNITELKQQPKLS